MTLEPLPLAQRPDDRESLRGYLLRVAAIHHLSLRQLFQGAGLHWRDTVGLDDLPTLARYCGAPLDWLVLRAPQPVFEKRWQLHWMGLPWRSPQTTRYGRPAICAACIHDTGVVSLEWDLGWFAFCPRHAVALADRCLACRHPVRWNRPSVDVCRCKRPFRRVKEGTAPDDAAMELLEWVGASVVSSSRAAYPRAWIQRLFPGEPSPDGVWRVVWAFGARPAGDAPDRSGNGENDAAAFGLVLTRGLQRLRQAVEAAVEPGSIYANALRWQAVRGVTASDRALAKHLLLGVFGKAEDRHWRRPEGEQLSLFSGDAA